MLLHMLDEVDQLLCEVNHLFYTVGHFLCEVGQQIFADSHQGMWQPGRKSIPSVEKYTNTFRSSILPSFDVATLHTTNV